MGARDCPRISREATELDMQLRTLPEGAEKAKMVQTYGQLVLKREYICGMQRRQGTALDQVQIEITATPNLPVQVLTVGRYLDSILKGLLVEYVNQLPNIHNRDMHGVKMIIEFDQRLQALNLKITSPWTPPSSRTSGCLPGSGRSSPCTTPPTWSSRSTGQFLASASMASASSSVDTCTPSTRRPTTTNWTTVTTWSLLTAPRGTLTPSWPRRRTTPSTS